MHTAKLGRVKGSNYWNTHISQYHRQRKVEKLRSGCMLPQESFWKTLSEDWILGHFRPNHSIILTTELWIAVSVKYIGFLTDCCIRVTALLEYLDLESWGRSTLCIQLCFICVTQQFRQKTDWKASLKSIQLLRKIRSWNVHPISRYVKTITSRFQQCRTRIIT